MNRRKFMTLVALLVAAAACNKQEVRSPEAPPTAPSPNDRLSSREAADRQELVSPAPDHWEPTSADPQLKLALLAEKTTLHSGEKFRYLLEIQNVGARDYEFHENPSFIKTGESALSDQYKFILTYPDGASSELYPPMPAFGAMPPPAKYPFSRMTKAEVKAAMDKISAEKDARDFLFLRLHTGETLSTRPDSPSGRFRTLATASSYDRPGTYGIKLIYDAVNADGTVSPIESNSVSFEVIP